MSQLSEAEIQVLIVLIELAHPKVTPNNNHYTFYPKTIEEASKYFRELRVDWNAAYPELLEKELIESEWEGYALTKEGVLEAERVRDERPPIYYWYREFFTRSASSRVYAKFCERLYGRNLLQAGFSDMEQIDKLLEVVSMNSQTNALDLGCGSGMVAEYLADRSGAHFTGIDYIPEAVQMALERTREKRDRLDFVTGNLDTLEFPRNSFDLILSIDTLYMPNQLERTVERIMDMLKPGGWLAAYYFMPAWDNPEGRSGLWPENTPLGEVLTARGVMFTTYDFTAQTYCMMQRKRQLGLEMQSEFIAEGNQVLADFILTESESCSEPYDPATCSFSRWLYLTGK